MLRKRRMKEDEGEESTPAETNDVSRTDVGSEKKVRFQKLETDKLENTELGSLTSRSDPGTEKLSRCVEKTAASWLLRSHKQTTSEKVRVKSARPNSSRDASAGTRNVLQDRTDKSNCVRCPMPNGAGKVRDTRKVKKWHGVSMTSTVVVGLYSALIIPSGDAVYIVHYLCTLSMYIVHYLCTLSMYIVHYLCALSMYIVHHLYWTWQADRPLKQSCRYMPPCRLWRHRHDCWCSRISLSNQEIRRTRRLNQNASHQYQSAMIILHGRMICENPRSRTRYSFQLKHAYILHTLGPWLTS